MNEITDASWRQEVLQADLPVLVLFWAPWDGGSKQFRPIFEQVAERYEGRLLCMTMNMDAASNVPDSLSVRTLPSTAFVQSGELVILVPGVQSDQNMNELIERHLALRLQERAG